MAGDFDLTGRAAREGPRPSNEPAVSGLLRQRRSWCSERLSPFGRRRGAACGGGFRLPGRSAPTRRSRSAQNLARSAARRPDGHVRLRKPAALAKGRPLWSPVRPAHVSRRQDGERRKAGALDGWRARLCGATGSALSAMRRSASSAPSSATGFCIASEFISARASSASSSTPRSERSCSCSPLRLTGASGWGSR